MDQNFLAGDLFSGSGDLLNQDGDAGTEDTHRPAGPRSRRLLSLQEPRLQIAQPRNRPLVVGQVRQDVLEAMRLPSAEAQLLLEQVQRQARPRLQPQPLLDRLAPEVHLRVPGLWVQVLTREGAVEDADPVGVSPVDV